MAWVTSHHALLEGFRDTHSHRACIEVTMCDGKGSHSTTRVLYKPDVSGVDELDVYQPDIHVVQEPLLNVNDRM